MIKNLLQKNSFHIVLTVVVMCMFFLAACDKKQPPVAVPPPQAKIALPVSQKVSAQKPVQNQVSSSLRLAPRPVNQFDFSKKKDPFKPFVVIKTEPKNSPAKQKMALRNSLPIHSYDIGQFKLIGVITGGRESQAMVTDPGGKGYVLKVGMHIGKNDGRVISINSSGVDILEQFKDDNGKVRKENIKLTLPRKQ